MIVSRQNQKIKDIRRLRRCKGELALLEGPHLVGEAVRLGLPLEFTLLTPDFAEQALGGQLYESPRYNASLVEPRLLEQICDADSPRGVLAVTTLPPTALEAIPVEPKGLYLYVDGVQDPGNLGALARLAEAFGCCAVVLGPGTVHPNHPRALRASAGSLLRILISTPDVPPGDLDRHLAPVSPQWAVLTPRDGEPLDQIETSACLVLAIGAEGPGVSAEVLARADARITIPLRGEVESLNSAAAAAIALYALSAPDRGS